MHLIDAEKEDILSTTTAEKNAACSIGAYVKEVIYCRNRGTSQEVDDFLSKSRVVRNVDLMRYQKCGPNWKIRSSPVSEASLPFHLW